MTIRYHGIGLIDGRNEAEELHSCGEILIVMEGNGVLTWIERTYRMSQNGIFVIPPHTPHHVRRCNGTIHQPRYCYVEVQDDILTQFPQMSECTYWNRMQSSEHADFPIHPEVTTIGTNVAQIILHDLPMERAYSHEFLQVEVHRLLLLIKQSLVELGILSVPDNGSTNSAPARDTHDEVVLRVMREMEKDYRSPVTLDKYVGLAHMSASYLIRLFKENTGMTPMRYLSHLRMNAATSYLQFSGMSIQDVAAHAGFTDIHHFYHTFKHRYGMSPQQWRNVNKTS